MGSTWNNLQQRFSERDKMKKWKGMHAKALTLKGCSVLFVPFNFFKVLNSTED